MFPWKSTILSFCAIALPFFLVALHGIGREQADAALRLLERNRGKLWVLWVLAFVLLNAVPLFVLGLPLASVHDELSYLLGADTFAHGRWTNPPLPSWESFETLYVQQQPTYASIYPPGSALTLAAGQVITGHPYWGLFLLNALLAACLPWAFSAWVSFPVAWVASLIWGGGIICTYWTHGYWGGSLAALLGTLSLGALGRSLRGQGTGYWLLLGFSLGALSFVRPFEGLFLALGLGAFFIWSERSKSNWIALLAPLLACLALWFYYNFRVTGNPLLHPYFHYFATYIGKPFFWGQGERAVAYRHPEIELMLTSFGGKRTFLELLTWKTFVFFFPLRPIAGLILLLGGIYSIFQKKTIPLLLALAGALLATLLSRFNFPHYVAPYFAFLGLALALGVDRFLQLEWRQRAWGFALVVGLLLASVGNTGEALVNMLRGQRELRLLTVIWKNLEYPPYSLNFGELSYAPAKERIKEKLLQIPGGHLVFVRYAASHSPHNEWVYNGADLAAQRIVWARHYTEESRGVLRKHFSDHTCWVIEADQIPPSLGPCVD